MEIFRGYFYDEKKNTRRKKSSMILMFALYIVLMVGVIGGIFTGLSVMLCKPLVIADMGWLYFLLTGMISIALGAFGSVFSTYAGLYLAKDNDLLLSLPIRVDVIIASRLASVYLLGLIYSAVVSVPAMIVYLVNFFSVKVLFASLVMVILISFFVAELSCLLGNVVARISQKLKNKSFITVIVSVLFLGGYYFVYFKAQSWISLLVEHASLYGNMIKGKAYFLYLLGSANEGNPLGLLAAVLAVGVIGAVTWLLLSKSFIKLATSTGRSAKVSTELKFGKRTGVDSALLRSEFRRFTGSANYMLNCGLGTLMLIVSAVIFIIKGGAIVGAMDAFFEADSEITAIILCAGICLIASMNDMVVPSVSLEGKSLWIKQSLPVTWRQVLMAKFNTQVILTAIPAFLSVICLIPSLNCGVLLKVLIVLFVLIYPVFGSAFGLFLGTRNPGFVWTNELMPIKQSGEVMIALLGGWVIPAAFGFLYMAFGYKIGAEIWMVISGVILVVLGYVFSRAAFAKKPG